MQLIYKFRFLLNFVGKMGDYIFSLLYTGDKQQVFLSPRLAKSSFVITFLGVYPAGLNYDLYLKKLF